jgi:Holliday junction resolvase
MARHEQRVYFAGDDGTPRAQEDRIAAAVGGQRVPGSGCSHFAKGDVRQDAFLIECKKTESASLSVKQSWLEKITAEAEAQGKFPALAIEIQGGERRLAERDWIAVPRSVFERLLGEG